MAVWHSQGMACPHFTTYTQYAPNWRLQHVQFVKITFCPVEGCMKVCRDGKLKKKHLKMEHTLSSKKVKSTVLKDYKEHKVYFQIQRKFGRGGQLRSTQTRVRWPNSNRKFMPGSVPLPHWHKSRRTQQCVTDINFNNNQVCSY